MYTHTRMHVPNQNNHINAEGRETSHMFHCGSLSRGFRLHRSRGLLSEHAAHVATIKMFFHISRFCAALFEEPLNRLRFFPRASLDANANVAQRMDAASSANDHLSYAPLRQISVKHHPKRSSSRLHM